MASLPPKKRPRTWAFPWVSFAFALAIFTWYLPRRPVSAAGPPQHGRPVFERALRNLDGTALRTGRDEPASSSLDLLTQDVHGSGAAGGSDALAPGAVGEVSSIITSEPRTVPEASGVPASQ